MWLALSTCAHRGSAVVGGDDPQPEAAPARPLDRYRAAFALTWNGARIGYASERFRDNQLFRREEITVRRGDALVQLVTILTIATDDAGRAQRIAVERRVGATITRGRAWRAGDRWRVRFGDEPERTVSGAAVPIELVPLAMARAGLRRFDGDVLLSGYGFAAASISVRPSGRADQLAVSVTTGAGRAITLVDLSADGTIARVRGEVGAQRIARGELGAPFRPPELVDTSSMPVVGVAPSSGVVRLRMSNAPPRLPPALPGQTIERHGNEWRVTLHGGDHGDARLSSRQDGRVDPAIRGIAMGIIRNAGARSPHAKLVALTRATGSLLSADMATPVHEARAALALGRGDCTSHSALLASLAAAVGLEARLVTGFRLDGDRMVRHRWVIGRLGRRWMAVDPTYGEAPAAPRLLGLAVHDSSAAQLAIVDDMAFAGFAGVRVEVTPGHGSESAQSRDKQRLR